MPTTYYASEGETVDLICWKHYGTEHGTTEAVLVANPALCGLPPHLPLGTPVLLPDLAAPSVVVDVIRVWD
jgi:phage tail protein X